MYWVQNILKHVENIYYVFSLLYVFFLHFFWLMFEVYVPEENHFQFNMNPFVLCFLQKFVFDCSFTKNSSLQVTVSKIGYCYKIDYCYNTLTLTAIKYIFWLKYFFLFQIFCWPPSTHFNMLYSKYCSEPLSNGPYCVSIVRC